MNKLNIEIETEENFSEDEVKQINEIFHALIRTGSLTGMRNGSATIHFDKDGEFKGIRADHWAWKKR